jgi:hypothetical protein
MPCSHRECAGIAVLEKDAPRPGRTPTITDRRVRRVVDMTLHQKPASATHWSTRTMARAAGISEASVRRIWRAHGLKPHQVRTFTLRRDPQFQEKLEDIVGLYMNPPEHAMVLCADEKSQIQALDRTQPGLPMKKGRCGCMTHDYKRNGTATLLAALDDRGLLRHPQTSQGPALARPSSPLSHALHTYGCSWLNMVERFFRDLTQNRPRRGVFRSVEELITAIFNYIDHHNDNPKPFIWTAKAADILEKVKRARAPLHNRPSA